MQNQQASTPAKPKTLNIPKQPFVPLAAISDEAGLENQIKERAHQLYEGRGREPGGEMQDWVQAEHEILKRT